MAILFFIIIILLQTKTITSQADETLYKMYDVQSQIVQQKLQVLYATLDRIERLENELREFKAALGSFYQDM